MEITSRRGEVRERLNRAVSKTVEPLRVPWVRIPPSPPEIKPALFGLTEHNAITGVGKTRGGQHGRWRRNRCRPRLPSRMHLAREQQPCSLPCWPAGFTRKNNRNAWQTADNTPTRNEPPWREPLHRLLRCPLPGIASVTRIMRTKGTVRETVPSGCSRKRCECHQSGAERKL
jgi:hypothetical protein